MITEKGLDMSGWKYMVALTLFSLSAGHHGYADDSWSTLPIPPYATKVTETVYLDNSAHQHYFIVKKPYPFNGVKDYYIANLAASWVLCSMDSADWEDFVDGTRQPEVYIHQKMVYWADLKRNRFLSLGLRYESNVPNPFRTGPPDNDRQNVYVNEYLDKDIRSTLEFLKIKCIAK